MILFVLVPIHTCKWPKGLVKIHLPFCPVLGTEPEADVTEHPDIPFTSPEIQLLDSLLCRTPTPNAIETF